MILDAVADWQELSALYEEAEALDDAARAAWLARLRADPHRLLPQVERMLAARARIAGNAFLEALPVLDTSDEAAPSEWDEGSRVGAYRLVRHLGSGGMAEVWLADRVDGAFERQVAIKLLFDHPSRARRETFVERFRRERDILASLDHPNIARLHDAGVTPSGQPWLALEYVQGESITAWCDHRCVDLQGRVRIFRQVLLAVQHAHANLVLHRDLKPANILVTEQGQVRLLDFGIAKLFEGGGDTLEDTALTRQAGRLLTLQYASPEQIQGVALTTACDIYAAGVVLYEMLCGERPYDVARTSPAALEEAILNLHPRPPGSRTAPAEVVAARSTTPGRLKKTLGGDIGAVVLRALAKQPGNRYRSAEGFGADLDRWLSGLPVEATSPTVWDRAISFVRRHLAATSLASAAVLAILVATGAAIYQATRASDEARRAVAAREFVFDLFKSADPNAAKDEPTSIRSVLAAGVRTSAQRFAADPVLRAEILQQIGQVQSRLGEKSDALRTYTEAVDLFRRNDDRRWVRAQIELADLHGRMGTTTEAFSLLAELDRLIDQQESDPELVSLFHLNKGWLLRYEQRLPEARAEMEHALRAAQRIETDQGERATDVLRGLAGVEHAQNDWPAAIAHIDEAALWTKNHPRAPLNHVIGVGMEQQWIRLNAGDYKIASELGSSYGKQCSELLGELSEQCIVLLDHQVQLFLVVGDKASLVAAMPRLRPAHDALSSPVRKALLLITAARAHAAVSDSVTADDWTEALRGIAEAGPNVSLPAMYKLSANVAMAECALRRGDAGDAVQWLDRFVRLRSGSTAPTDPLELRATVLRGIALGLLGDPDASLRTLQAAASKTDAVLGPSHTLGIIYRLNMLSPLLALGRLADAAQVLDTALPALRERLGAESPLTAHVEELRAQLPKHPSPLPVKPPSDFFV
jgi:serine/threonine protein kinase